MRPFELTLSILILFVALSYFFPQVSAPLKYQILPLILVLVAGAQMLFEGFRWQLYPLFGGILLLALVALLKASGWGAGIPLGLTVLLAVVSIVAGALLPVPHAYKISGPYQVGTTTAYMADPSRQEIYGDDPNAPREIMVQVWYPAEPARESIRSQWMSDIKSAAPAIATYIELPSFALDHLKYVKANAYLDAPLIQTDTPLPVLIFSHGWAGFKEQNIFQVEELASHGYVVVGINHTYGAILTVFPDGREIPRSPDALPSGVTQAEYDVASNKLVRQWLGDIGFVLDELAALEPNADLGVVAGKIDLGEVGVFGHSTGGGATAEFCATDARCKAALTMDLWGEPVSDEVISAGLTQPFMLMHSEVWGSAENHKRVRTLVDASTGEVIEFSIRGTTHYDFSSLPLLSPLASSIGLKGPIDGDAGLEIINTYSVRFFDQALRGKTTDWSTLNAQYPDVLFGVRP